MKPVFQKRKITPCGIAYSEQGSGPVVILLHGVGLCGDVWRPQQQMLSATAKVVAVDLPGHGGSQAFDPSTSRSLEDYVLALEQAIAHIAAGPAMLVGHSLGALLSAHLCVRSRTNIRSVCLISGVYQRSEAAMQAVIKRANELQQRDSGDLALSPLERWFGSKPDDIGRANVRQCRQWLEHSVERGYPAAYKVFAEQSGPSESLLRSIHVPALFLTGAEDPNSTPAMSQAMAAVVAKGEAHVVADAAHMVTMTHANYVNSVLSDFSLQ